MRRPSAPPLVSRGGPGAGLVVVARDGRVPRVATGRAKAEVGGAHTLPLPPSRRRRASAPRAGFQSRAAFQYRAPMRTLYHFRLSPYSRRARLALAHKGLDCELRDARENPALLEEARALVPFRTVPVLVD